MISETIINIEKLLNEIGELQKASVKTVCWKCLKPCCLRVRYPFNKKDVLYLRLSNQTLQWNGKGFKKPGCWFLRNNGCSLDYPIRPFLCHTYLCQELREDIKNSKPLAMKPLKEKLKEVEKLRSDMWKQYGTP